VFTRNAFPVSEVKIRAVRRVLIETSWHYQHRPSVGPGLAARRKGQPARIIAIADKAQQRRCRRFRRLTANCRGTPVRFPLAAFLLGVVAVVACARDRPPVLAEGVAGDEGLDPARLADLEASLARRNTDALVVLRHGKIVLEWYADGFTPDSRHGLASVSKAVVGGVALALALEGDLVEIDEPASDLIPAWRSDPIRAEITLGQLATHTSGVEDAEEDGLEHAELPGWKGDFWARDPDPFTIALAAAPILRKPGTAYVYSNPGYAAMGYALSAAFARAGRGSDLRQVLDTRVMRPLGLTDDDWRVGYEQTYRVDGLDLVATWGGASYTARAVATVGQLLLRRGEWHGARLVDGATVDAVTTYEEGPRPAEGTPTPTPGFYSNIHRTFARLPRDAFFGGGDGQKVLAVVPSLGLVAVRLGRNMGGEFWEGIDRYVLTPLADAVVEPPYPPSEVIRRIDFGPETDIVRRALGSDNWPITWTRDGSQFTAYGDGWGFEPPVDQKLSLGLARIEGGPGDFTGHNVRSATAETTGDGEAGAKASGLLEIDGTLYMWVRNLDNARVAWSRDGGASWEWGFWFDSSFGAPTFLQFGRGYAGSRDGYVYVYSHDHASSYDPGPGVLLARVPRESILERDAYEFFVRLDGDGGAEWTSDIARLGRVLDYPGRALRTDAVHHPGLDRILLAMAFDFEGGWGIFDAPTPWGPWSTAFHTFDWGLGPTHGYRLPAKWILDNGSMYVVFSGLSREAANYDAFSVRRMELRLYAD
jgi:CubicO group peptidase (beta-lactamase class C family)